VECGWVPPNTPINAFEATMRSVCEPIFEKPLKDISFGMLLLQLFRTASRFNMEVQPSLVLLQKTLLNVEGLGKQLYPELDLWENALPFLENWQRKRLSPITNLKKITEKLPQWLEQLPEIPELIFETLQELKLARSYRETMELEARMQEAQRKQQLSRRYTFFGVAALIAASISLHPTLADWLEHMHLTSLILATAGIILMVLRQK